MKKLVTILFISIIALMFTGAADAQTPASATWALTNPTSGGTGFDPSTSGLVKAFPENLMNMEVNQYTGANNSQRLRIIGNSWPTWRLTQIDTVYFDYCVTPAPGNTMTITSVSMSLGAASTSYMKANIYYSKDSTFATSTPVDYVTGNTKNYLTSGGMTQISVLPNVTLNDGERFYFRVYPWVDSSSSISGKYICPQNVVISGTTQVLATPASATWPLTNPTAGGTGFDPTTSGLIKALPENLKNMEVNQYTGANNSQRLRIIGNSWPTWRLTQIDTVYFDYCVMPVTGGNLNITSLSMSLGAASSSNIKANIYYSKDSTFAASTPVDYVTGNTKNYLTSSGMTQITATPNVTVNDGERFYLRVYPWVDSSSSISGKYVCPQNVVISGTATGVGASLATLITNKSTYISTTTAKSGGTISADGGAAVTARGVCWNTSSGPTISNNKTSDGIGSGQFVSNITLLTPGTTYYVRAYATNTAGTVYGNEDTLTTLLAKTVPVVTTTAVTSVMTTTATSGGNVTAWGGDAVTAKGICWNATGSPTIADAKTTNGSDIGSFTSALYNLQANKKYYVRAYATNSVGTGYGDEQQFTTQTPAASVTKVVAKNGTGDYTTLQAAFDAVPDFYTGTYTIYVKRGTYKEKVTLGQNKTNVVLIGEDRDSTVITYDDYSGRVVNGTTLGTSTCQTLAIDGNDFTASNITIQNTSTAAQAVALRVNGDRGSYYNCNLLGYQDTYYTWGSYGTVRTYHKNCKIVGSVDFIFGRNVVYFDSCTINVNRNTGTLTAASTDSTSKFGYVFNNCKITSDSIGFDGNPITSFYLGRPWQFSPRTVFMNCDEPATLNAAGWQAWNVVPALYAEYKCKGAGYQPSGRVSWSSILSDADALTYTVANIFSANTSPSFGYDWMPTLQPTIPVELTSFTAKSYKDNVTLFWATATETNNSGFYIEKKTASGKFENISFVKGKGTTTERSSYTYTDTKVPNGNVTYRLKQVDYDGTFAYSSELNVNVSGPLVFSLSQNYPNPFNPVTVIKFSIPADGMVNMSVYNILGEKVATLVNQAVKAGTHEVNFDASRLSSGVYFYKIESGKFNDTKKLMLLK